MSLSKFGTMVIAFFILAILFCAGCTQQPPEGHKNKGVVTSTPLQTAEAIRTTTPQPSLPPAGRWTKATPAPKHNGVVLDNTYNIQYNNFLIINLKDELGVDYIYPDDTYKLEVSSASSPQWGHVNVLVLDDIDVQKFKGMRAEWDTAKKTWSYPGIVPFAQMNDLMSKQTKTFRVKKMSYYYICIDDRKEEFPPLGAFEVYVKLTQNP